MSEQGAGQGNPPPGWYPDPDRPGNRRWWDGLTWTDFSEPMEGAGQEPGAPGSSAPSDPGSTPAYGPPPGSYGGPPAAYGGAPGGYGGTTGFAGGAAGAGPAPAIDTWLWQSIVATVLCCLPLGIPGIVFASQAQTEINNRNYPLAQEKAKQAKTFTLISGGLGLLMWFGWIGLFFLPFMLIPMGV